MPRAIITCPFRALIASIDLSLTAMGSRVQGIKGSRIRGVKIIFNMRTKK